MIPSVLALIDTLFQILRLKKGPEAVPRALAALIVAFAMWIAAVILVILLFDDVNAGDFSTALLTTAAGLACYTVLLNSFGKSARLLPMLTSVTGCGALLLVIFASVFVALKPFVGADVALRVAYPFTLWSVPVDGHIIARALDRPFIVGFLFALAVFVLQVVLQQLVDPVVAEVS